MDSRAPGKSDAGTVALLSGGVDSAVMVGLGLAAGDDVWPLYVRQGFVWEDEEARAVEKFLATFRGENGVGRINGAGGAEKTNGVNRANAAGGDGHERLHGLATSTLGAPEGYPSEWATDAKVDAPDENSPDEAVYLPGRNLALLTQAAIYAHTVGAARIQLGVLRGNPFPDATDAFFRSFERTVSEAMNLSISIETPLGELSKTDVLLRGQEFSLGTTLSCIRPRDGVHCGRCNKCEERRRAFAEANLHDAAKYMTG